MRIFLFIVIFQFAALAGEGLVLKKEHGDIAIKMTTFDNVRFSQDCAEKKCAAYKVFRAPKKARQTQSKIMGNPASKYCAQQGGRGYILRDSKNRQYDFCGFSDGSFVDAWGLYENR